MWKHPKIKDKAFIGNYEMNKNSKRILILEHFTVKGKKDKTFKFTSWQDAKKNGWILVK